MHFLGRATEVFAVIFLDSRHRVLAVEDLFFGTLDAASVYPREIVRKALLRNAAAVVLAHNHPSGISESSLADSTDQKHQQALTLLGIRLLDHVGVGQRTREHPESDHRRFRVAIRSGTTVSSPPIIDLCRENDMARTNRKWVLKSRPEVEVEQKHFALEEESVAPIADGQVLLEHHYLTVNPPMRMALVSGGITGKPYPLGRTMYGGGLARVIESRSPDFKEGDLVQGELGWQLYSIVDPRRRAAVKRVKAPDGLPETTLMHVLGSSGTTAYFGITEYARPKPGDTLVVSTAAGSVGALVCQLGRIQGCRVIGITGSDAKCKWLTDASCASPSMRGRLSCFGIIVAGMQRSLRS